MNLYCIRWWFSSVLLKIRVALVFLTPGGYHSVNAQEWINKDYVYQDYIKSVQFMKGSSPLMIASTPLNSNITLHFDDLSNTEDTYYYRLIHCNADWTPSTLAEMEYIEGFNDSRIENWEYSIATKVEYTHYTLNIPNEDVAWTKTGNYLLQVYFDDNEEVPVLSRRIIVYENLFSVHPGLTMALDAGALKTHQRIEFQVSHPKIQINNPLLEIKAFVLQNGNWTTAQGVVPRSFREEQLHFDLTNAPTFPGGNEFRILDIRSLRSKAYNTLEVLESPKGYEVLLEPDKKRIRSRNVVFFDNNGMFTFNNTDQNWGRIRSDYRFSEDNRTTKIVDGEEVPLTERELEQRQLELRQLRELTSEFNQRENERIDNLVNLRSDYAKVYFSLYSPTEFEEEEVYFWGALTDWNLLPEYRLQYDPSISSYLGSALLKQGFYDYEYVTVKKVINETPEVSHEYTEGNYQQTENAYTVLIYWKPFGARYDKPVAIRTFQVNNN